MRTQPRPLDCFKALSGFNSPELDCLFKTLSRLSTEKPSKLCITDTLCWEPPTVNLLILAKRASNAERCPCHDAITHYNDVIMSVMTSQITSLAIVYLIIYSRRRSNKTSKSASLAFVRGIHRGPVNSPHKRQVTRKMFPFDDVIMVSTWE